jgi:hypothetical protein
MLAYASASVLASPHVESIHLLHDIRKSVEVVLLIVLVIGLVIGFMLGRISKRGR